MSCNLYLYSINLWFFFLVPLRNDKSSSDNKNRKLNKDDIFSDYKIEGQIIDLLTFLIQRRLQL